jgi:hypothetical protein
MRHGEYVEPAVEHGAHRGAAARLQVVQDRLGMLRAPARQHRPDDEHIIAERGAHSLHRGGERLNLTGDMHPVGA